MASLSSFSEELLDRTISLVVSRHDLTSVMRVSRRLHRIALPYLYTEISLKHSWKGQGIHGDLESLLIVLLQRPELASLVKSFALRPMVDIDKPSNVLARRRDTSLERLILDAVKQQVDDEAAADQLYDTVMDGSEAAATIALLLPLLTNLQRLDCPFTQMYGENGEAAENDYVMKMMERVVTKRSPFEKLTDVILPGIEHKYPNNPDLLAACVRLPAIKRLYGFNQGNEDESGEDLALTTRVYSKIEPHSSCVEFIELRKCKLQTTNFDLLMAGPKSLKTLIYEVGNTWAWTRVNFSATQTSMERQKTNLERLSLGHMLDYFPFMTHDVLTPMSFSAFTSLVELRVAPIFLYGQDALQLDDGSGVRQGDPPAQEQLESTKFTLANSLPPQIMTLKLLSCQDPSSIERLVISLREVLSRRPDQFTHLQQVTIHGMDREVLNDKITLLETLPWKVAKVRLLVHAQNPFRHGVGEYRIRPWGWDEDVEWKECLNDTTSEIKVIFDSDN